MPDPGPAVTLTLDASTVDDVRSLGVAAVVHHAGTEPIRIDTLPMDYAATVLQVRDGTGAPVPGMPPSVPPLLEEDTTILLEPGASATFAYRGSSLFHDPLEPGPYAIRFRVELAAGEDHGAWSGTLESDWVPFVVTSPAGQDA